jgi:hypothetical protein
MSKRLSRLAAFLKKKKNKDEVAKHLKERSVKK